MRVVIWSRISVRLHQELAVTIVDDDTLRKVVCLLQANEISVIIYSYFDSVALINSILFYELNIYDSNTERKYLL